DFAGLGRRPGVSRDQLVRGQPTRNDRDLPRGPSLTIRGTQGSLDPRGEESGLDLRRDGATSRPLSVRGCRPPPEPRREVSTGAAVMEQPDVLHLLTSGWVALILVAVAVEVRKVVHSR